MCGRYAASRRPEDLVEEFEVATAPTETLAADFNVAPTKQVYAVLARADKVEPGEPVRQLRVVRWGLVPSWAKDVSIGNRLVNARVETLTDRPSFRRAFASRRCLLPADGYYEWYVEEGSQAVAAGPAGKPRKQPFFIHRKDGGVLAMAGLYELWRDPAKADDDPARWLWSCVVLTTEAVGDLRRIHDRMPLLVERDGYARWLDPAVSDPALLGALLVPAGVDRLEAYPVSTAVNSARNNGPHLLDPLPAS